MVRRAGWALREGVDDGVYCFGPPLIEVQPGQDGEINGVSGRTRLGGDVPAWNGIISSLSSSRLLRAPPSMMPKPSLTF